MATHPLRSHCGCMGRTQEIESDNSPQNFWWVPSFRATLYPCTLSGYKEDFAMISEATTVLREPAAARMLGVSKAALRRWRREGRGPSFVRLERVIGYRL